MKKEHAKNIILSVLVVMNFVLGSKILIDKKLWPSGYNFFNVENFPVTRLFMTNRGEKRHYEKAVHLTMPEKIIFNTGDQATRFSLNSNNKEYSDVLEHCNEILVAAFSAGDERVSEVNADEWFSSLMTESIYLSYYTEYSTELFAKFLGLNETPFSGNIHGFSNVVISLYDNVTVYIEDADTNKYYSIKTGKRFSEFKKAAEGIINAFEKDKSEGSAINYSFDLNFDKSFGTQKTIIDSMVPIYSNEQIVPVVNAKSPVVDMAGNLNNGTLNKIVDLFNVNSNIARRYREADGTVVFVENNAILKIHTNGMVEYRATGNGLQLTSLGGGYNVISNVNDFVARVNKAAGGENNMYLSSVAKEGENVIAFDYMCQGMPVKMAVDNTKNAVRCTVSNGFITEYIHVLRKYEESGEYAKTPTYITAVDNTSQKYSDVTGTVTINRLYLAYNDTGVLQKLAPSWTADVEDVILNMEE